VDGGMTFKAISNKYLLNEKWNEQGTIETICDR
jgi:hypothetical protein